MISIRLKKEPFNKSTNATLLSHTQNIVSELPQLKKYPTMLIKQSDSRPLVGQVLFFLIYLEMSLMKWSKEISKYQFLASHHVFVRLFLK